MTNFDVIEKSGKFVVTKNGEPILLPKTDGAAMVTEFSNKEDAQKYMGILEKLSKQKKYQKT